MLSKTGVVFLDPAGFEMTDPKIKGYPFFNFLSTANIC
jgi:hypothetical protein